MNAQKIEINGIAINEGKSRNGVIYNSEELINFAPTMVGRPILKDHESLTDNVIGKITEAKSINGGKSVAYKGWIKEDGTGIVEKIKDSRISEVSIGAIVGRLVKESEDSEDVIAKDMTAIELSTTPTPGVNGTSVSQSEAFTEDEVSEMIKKHESHFNSYKEVNEMAEENEKIEDSEEEVAEEATEEVEDKSEELEVANEKIKALEKQIKESAIASYKKLCESKGLKCVKTESLSTETIKVLTEQVEEVEVAEEEAEVEAPAEEATEEAPAEAEAEAEVKEAEEPKEDAEVTSEEAPAEEEAEDVMEGYVLEQSDFGGSVLFKK